MERRNTNMDLGREVRRNVIVKKNVESVVAIVVNVVAIAVTFVAVAVAVAFVAIALAFVAIADAIMNVVVY